MIEKGRGPGPRWPWAGGALVAVAAFWIAFVWLWEPAYLTLTVDDSFYYFQIARNVAAGLGSTFDGVQPTNGYHPLWLAVLVPIAGLPGDELPVRLALTLQVLLVVGGVWWLGRRLPSPVGTAFVGITALALAAFHATKIVVNGQESALQWVLLCVAMAYLGGGLASLRHGVILGALGAALTLARLDAIAFAGVAALLPVLWPRGGTPVRARLVTTATALGVLGTGTAGYAAWNLRTFGHPLPVHMAIKADWVGAGIESLLLAVVFALALAVSLARIGRRLAPGVGADLLYPATPLVAYAGFLVTAQSFGGWRWLLQLWYLPPLLLLALLVVSTLALSRTGRRVLVAGCLLWIGPIAWSWHARLEPRSYSTYLGARDTGRWIREALPAQSRIAGWDIGSVAWHAGGGITNLEGLAATWEYKREVLDRRRVAEYLDEESVDYLVQPFPDASLTSAFPPDASPHLGKWRVVHTDCRLFESVAPGIPAVHRVHTVLAREDGGTPTWSELAASGKSPCNGPRLQ